MGAYGAALLAGEKVKGESSFKGFTIPEVKVGEVTCRKCENTCRITVVKTGSEKVSWGYLCGRDPDSPAKARRSNDSMRLRHVILKHHSPGPQEGTTIIRVPALPLYEEFIPLFTEIGRVLGIPIQVMSPGKEEILSLIHISEPTRLLSNSYAVLCLKTKKKKQINTKHRQTSKTEYTDG